MQFQAINSNHYQIDHCVALVESVKCVGSFSGTGLLEVPFFLRTKTQCIIFQTESRFFKNSTQLQSHLIQSQCLADQLWNRRNFRYLISWMTTCIRIICIFRLIWSTVDYGYSIVISITICIISLEPCTPLIVLSSVIGLLIKLPILLYISQRNNKSMPTNTTFSCSISF